MRRRFARGLALLGLAAPLCAYAAATQPKPEAQYFRIPWMVLPQDENANVLTLKGGQEVTRARLVPAYLLVADTDIIADDGRLIVPKGTEFAKADSDPFLACTIRPLKTKAFNQFFDSYEKYLCAVDEDRNGSFEYGFLRGERDRGILFGAVQVEVLKRLLLPNSYHAEPRDKSRESADFVIKYSHFASISGWLIFTPCIELESRRCLALDANFGMKLQDVPGRFDIMGGKFEVLGKTGNQIQIKVVSPFLPTPVGLER